MTAQAARLRVDRLVIVESRSPIKFIRDVALHAGLNIVWAQELLAAETEVDRAGHGVGKTTFSLMLRAVLGDEGVAVKTMRDHLAEHYGSGGIAAEVTTGGEQFAVFRSFGSHSFALKNATVEGLFEENAKANALDFATYVTTLGELACLQYMTARALPITGQSVDWEHVLCWVARDQALGLRQYFEWRNDEGSGLRRKVKDPPALLRLALGLLSDAEATAEEKIWSVAGGLTKARAVLSIEEQRGANTRSIVETQLRNWAGVSSSLQMVADDMFSDSVEQEIQRKVRQLDDRNQADRAELTELDKEIGALIGEIQQRERIVQLTKGRWEEAVALRNNDQSALTEIRERRDKLLNLSGSCQYGGVTYNDCRHVQEQRSSVKLTVARDVGVLSRAVGERQEREVTEKATYEKEAEVLAELSAACERKLARKGVVVLAIERRLRQLGQGEGVRETLMQWQESQYATETEKLRAARGAVRNLELKLEAAKRDKAAAQRQVSQREREIGERIAEFAKAFGANGRYMPLEEKRPFQMLGADGDAYTVLEILLGDLTCGVEGAEGKGAHPGLLIFDCPREREMSLHLYERFLTLVYDVGQKVPRLQVIVTTTTPPPEPLREPPTRILKLSRASEDDLLLKRRIEDLLSRTATSPPNSPEESSG
jgi:hypothetical protein